MAIEIPGIKDIQSRIANDLILSINTGQLDTTKHVDPTIRNSFIKGLVDATAGGFDENNDVLEQLIIQLFPWSATGIYLERWGAYYGINRNAAAKASGVSVFSGTTGSAIPPGTLVQRANGIQYSTQSNITISTQTINVSSIARLGSTATVTTASNHNLATGITIDSITGANETEYNVTNTVITVTGATTFTYEVTGTPTTPATGTIQTTFTTGFGNIEASEFGVAGNADAGSQLTLVSPITNVNNNTFVNQDGLVGGLDIESDDSLRARLQERTSSFSAPFTQAGLPVFIKEKVDGVTRTWIEDATPAAGQVTIYFTRDNDTNIIPTASQVTDVKNAIIDVDTGIKPANTPDSYVLVTAPTGVTVNFSFSSLSPNTEDMQTAITNALTDYFKNNTNVGQNVTTEEFNNIIFSVVDSSGNTPTFTLSAPVSDVTVNTGELAILGTVTYS
jgi:uncharacterized phage protein gp47/JayE